MKRLLETPDFVDDANDSELELDLAEDFETHLQKVEEVAVEKEIVKKNNNIKKRKISITKKRNLPQWKIIFLRRFFLVRLF